MNFEQFRKGWKVISIYSPFATSQIIYRCYVNLCNPVRLLLEEISNLLTHRVTGDEEVGTNVFWWFIMYPEPC